MIVLLIIAAILVIMGVVILANTWAKKKSK